MKSRAEWWSFGVFVVVVLAALLVLLRHGGVHGQSSALAVALLLVLMMRIGIFAWNLRRQREQLQRK